MFDISLNNQDRIRMNVIPTTILDVLILEPKVFGDSRGFFFFLSDSEDFLYKTTEYYAPQYERAILWSDPDLGIAWPLAGEPSLSVKDAPGVSLLHAELFF